MLILIHSNWETYVLNILLFRFDKMAHGHNNDEMKKEYFETPAELNSKIDQLTEWIKKSKHFIVFTGE